MKKYDGHNLCAMSRAKSSFDWFFMQSQKFKILAIPNVFVHVKSYEHGFMKKHDGHKLCAKSRTMSCFNQFFMHHLENSKYRRISTWEVVRAGFREKTRWS
ncbi:hypothetical protein BHE74_00056707 [Ensete ventricosum]|nr:hypothetical protein BHE74_00056707 [Ensete ventricosum]